MNIGDAAKASGLSAKMVRYYEEIGLIQPVLRTQSGYRIYGEGDIHTLRFIKRARSLGFSVDETSNLLALWRDKNRASADVKAIALSHMKDLEDRIANLEAMRQTLKHLADHCHGDGRPECPILEDMTGSQSRGRN